MPSPATVSLLLGIWMGIALIAMIALFFVDAPYGRRARDGWGPGVPNRVAWCLMESVVLISFLTTVAASGVVLSIPTWVMVGMLTLHYVNRSFVYPWRTRTRGKTMPLTIFLMSVAFNTANGFFLGADLTSLNRPSWWFSDPRFMLGTALFFAGMALNWHADNVLLGLRAPGETGYRIPRDWAFRRVTSPNLLGEMVEWAGFALLTWSLAGLAFLVWTLANLVPRARSNHRWYHETFDDYPRERHVLIPGVW